MAMNLIELLDRFANEETCRKHLEALRWPSGVACTRCGDMDVSPIKGRGQWHCIGCGYHFSVKSGTIIHDSHLPLRKWFAATSATVSARLWAMIHCPAPP